MGNPAAGNKHFNGYQQNRNFNRQVKKWRYHRVKLRDEVGVIGREHFLNFGLLNVDGLSDSSLEDVKSALTRKSLDLCILLETKRRYEEDGSDNGIDGYSAKI